MIPSSYYSTQLSATIDLTLWILDDQFEYGAVATAKDEGSLKCLKVPPMLPLLPPFWNKGCKSRASYMGNGRPLDHVITTETPAQYIDV